MTTETKPSRTIVRTGGAAGVLWTAGWMFTIAFAKLIWWKAILAIIVWPYFLGLVLH